MAFSLIVSTADGDDLNSVTTDAVDTTGADLIVVSVGWFDQFAPALSDSKGNTWTPLTQRDNGSYHVKLFYCVSPTVGSGHTFTAAQSASYPAIEVMAFSGVDTSDAFDQESAGGTASGATSVQPGSVTPDEDNCLVVTGLTTDPGSSHTINGTYTASALDRVADANVGGGIAYDIQTTATATNPTWSWTTSADAVAASAVFHAAAGGGGPAYNEGSVSVFSRRFRYQVRR